MPAAISKPMPGNTSVFFKKTDGALPRPGRKTFAKLHPGENRFLFYDVKTHAKPD